MKKAAAIISILVLLIGLGVGVYFVVNNSAIFKSKASCGSGCTVSVALDSSSYNVPTGTDVVAKVTLNTNNVEIQTININLTYNATDFSIIQPTNIDLDPSMIASGWIKEQGQIQTPGRIELVARYSVSTSSTGYKNNTATNFAVITLHGVANGSKTLSINRSSQATSGLEGMDVLNTPNSTATITVGTGEATTPKYKCVGSACTRDDSTGTYTSSTCNNECTAAVTPKYKCVGSACTRDDSAGTYTSSTCNNECTAAVTPKYKCSGNSCVQDNTNGTYSSSSCNNECTNSSNLTKPSTSTVLNNQTIQTSPTVINGTGNPGSIITITIHSSQSLTGTATVNSSGTWSWTLPDTLTNGAHTMTLADNQTPSQSTTVSFTITPPTGGGDSSSTTTHYACSSGSCVQSSTGPFTSSNCNNTCTTTTNTTTNASTTTNTTPTLPVTGTTENTLVIGFIGLLTVAIGAALFVF